ncbi:Inactive ubiquitin carboxyl-terminal hydrolase 53 [Varanus komodoensis]|nr:Inactive ubiquitin carboxyl-terminal hydrolase 53 [Varanus komodoensis]
MNSDFNLASWMMQLNVLVTDEHAKNSELYLVGMICYASKHYCAFAFHTKSYKWVLFDDANVKEVGTKWKDVVSKCIRCHFQPLLLFYANPDGTPVSTEDAPRQIIHWSHYKASAGCGEELDLSGEIHANFKPGSPPSGNGFRQHSNERVYSSQGRGPYKHEKIHNPIRTTTQMLSSNKTDGFSDGEKMSRIKADSITGYDTDSSQDSKDKGSVSSSSKSRSRGWRPMRETLNVDSIFSEPEKKEHSSKPKLNASNKPKLEKEHSSNNRPKENPSPKGLMTIYEDETKQAGHRSSLDSERKGNAEKGKGITERKVHSDTWQIQRTESGYESSDHISNASANLDSPVIEGTSPVDTTIKVTVSCSDQNLSSRYPGCVLQSTSQQNKNSLDALKKEQVNTHINYRPHNVLPASHLPMHSPPLKRTEVPDCNKFLPLTQQAASKDHTEKEMKNSALTEQSSVRCPNEDTLGETNIPMHSADSSVGSYNGENNISKPSYNEPASSAEHKVHLYSGKTDDTPEAIYQNLPPPLPPKKHVLTRLHGLEHESTVELKQTEVMCTNPSNTDRQVASFTSKATPEANPYTDDERLKASFHGNEPSKTDFSSSLSVNDSWAVSNTPTNKGACLKGPNASSLDGNANDIVSLTTYFSVDNCMTDTYRMKYHQRPKLYFADTGVLNKETALPPTGTMLNTSYHNTSESDYPTAEQRHKLNIGNMYCSR